MTHRSLFFAVLAVALLSALVIVAGVQPGAGSGSTEAWRLAAAGTATR